MGTRRSLGCWQGAVVPTLDRAVTNDKIAVIEVGTAYAQPDSQMEEYAILERCIDSTGALRVVHV